MDMTFRHLEIFEAVVETGSFTKAAKKLFITQSAVSHAVHDLEEMTGGPLFDRLGKSVRITKTGELLLQEAEPILTASKALEARLHTLEKNAPIHIACNITIANFYLPARLQAFSKAFPCISASVDVIPAATAIESLQRGKADLALVEGTVPQEPFSSKDMGAYALKAVCAPDYPLKERQLTLPQLCREKLLLREAGSAIRDTLDSQLYLAGCKAYPAWCSVNDSALLAAARAALGIAILPEAYVSEELKKQHLVELSIPDLVLENRMYAVWHRDKYLTEPLRALIEMCADIHQPSKKARSFAPSPSATK